MGPPPAGGPAPGQSGDQPPDHGNVTDRGRLPVLRADWGITVEGVGFDQRVDQRQVLLIFHRATRRSDASETGNPVLQTAGFFPGLKFTPFLQHVRRWLRQGLHERFKLFADRVQ